jgi:TRAP-type C4-dicarboxylate transport system permease small subunit
MIDSQWGKIPISIFRAGLMVSAVFIWLMAGLIFLDVILRFTLNRPLTGVYESSEVGFLIIVFLTLAWVTHKNRQLTLTLVSDRIKGRGKHLLTLFSNLVMIAFFGTILWYGTRDLIRAWKIWDVRQGLFQIPWVIPLSVIVLGCINLLFALVLDSLQQIRETKG